MQLQCHSNYSSHEVRAVVNMSLRGGGADDAVAAIVAVAVAVAFVAIAAAAVVTYVLSRSCCSW